MLRQRMLWSTWCSGEHVVEDQLATDHPTKGSVGTLLTCN
jgi:hypothetical protein